MPSVSKTQNASWAIHAATAGEPIISPASSSDFGTSSPGQWRRTDSDVENLKASGLQGGGPFVHTKSGISSRSNLRSTPQGADRTTLRTSQSPSAYPLP